MAKGYIAGILRHAQEITAVTNQWVNSYKRLVPGYEAPVYLSWARRNRSALVRVPMYKPGKEKSDVVRDALGEHVFHNFVMSKKVEWDDYRMQIHPYEFQKFPPIL